MGDGFATVDKRNRKTTGMSETLNPTMTADYRLRHISTLQDMDLSLTIFCMQWERVLLFTIILLDNSKSALHINAAYVELSFKRFGFWQQTHLARSPIKQTSSNVALKPSGSYTTQNVFLKCYWKKLSFQKHNNMIAGFIPLSILTEYIHTSYIFHFHIPNLA